MSALDREPFPRGALIAAGSLVVFSLVATTIGRMERLSAPSSLRHAVQPAPQDTVDLSFVDQADGAVSVRNVATGAQIATLAPGTNGFVRGVMRGLAHDRQTRHIGPGPAFRLSQWAGGRLVLEDTATGRRIDLDAFGVSNKDAFTQLLYNKGTGA